MTTETRKAERQGTIAYFATVTAIGITAVISNGWIGALIFGLIIAGALGQVAVIQIARRHSQKALIGVGLAVAFIAHPCRGQTGIDPGIPAPPAGDYGANIVQLAVSQPMAPPDPEMAPAAIPVIGGAICVGVVVGVVGWVGIKIWEKCISIQVRRLTNAAPVDLMRSPTSPVPDPTVTGGACDSCGDTVAIGDPLPIRIQHSADGDTWADVTGPGVIVGKAYSMPSTGRWRAVLLPLEIRRGQDGAVMLDAPPGVLERSVDLRSWTSVGTNYSSVTTIAGPGFYRVRL